MNTSLEVEISEEETGNFRNNNRLDRSRSKPREQFQEILEEMTKLTVAVAHDQALEQVKKRQGQMFQM